MTVDLGPAADQLAALVAGVRDDQLADPTPCERYAVGDLLDHIGGLAVAFTEAARKSGAGAEGPPPEGDVTDLDPEWRTTVPAHLRDLATAWQDPAAFEGMTAAGGLELPAEVAAVVALQEVTVHGWDLAKATGQPFAADPAAVAAVHDFVASFGEDPEVRGTIFGAPVPVGPGASALDATVALTGRDPGWSRP